MEFPGRDALRAVAEDDELLERVRGRHAHAPSAAQLVGDALDVLVGRLRLLRIDDVEVVVFFHRAQSLGHAVGVEDEDERAAAVGLVVAQQVHQQMPRRVEVVTRDFLQLVPREENVVPVHEQEFLRRLELRDELPLILRPELRRQKIPPPDLPVGALEDRQQLLLQLRRAAGGHRAHDAPRRLLRGCVRPPDRQMRVFFHVVPLDLEARAVRAEDGAGRVFEVALGVVADPLHDLALVVAGPVASDRAAQAAAALRVGRHLALVSAQLRHRGQTRQQRVRLPRHGRVQLGLHPLQIGHGPAHRLLRQLQPELIPRLEQHALRLFESLPHRAVGRLPEVPALRVLLVRPARQDRDAQVGHGRARQHAPVHLLHQVRENEPLPAPRERVLAADRVEDQAAARLAGLQQQVHLGVVAQRLVVPDALDRLQDRLAVDDAALAERDREAEPVPDQALQNLQLHLAHELHADLPQPRVPRDVQQRVLLVEPPELQIGRLRVARHLDAVFEHRTQHGLLRFLFKAQARAGHRVGKARRGQHRPGLRRVRQRVFFPGIQAELVRLFAVDRHFDAQAAARHLQKRQPRALRVAPDLVHARAEFGGIVRHPRIFGESLQKRVHAVELQRRAEPARADRAPRDEPGDLAAVQRPRFQIPLRERVVEARQPLEAVGGLHVHERAAELPVQLPQQLLPRPVGHVHLVHEHEHRHAEAAQQLPERVRVPLHAGRPAHDDERVVEHLQRPLRLGREIDVARRVEQLQLPVFDRQPRLLGEDGDAPLALERAGVEKRVPVIDAPEPSEHAALI